MIRLLTLLVSVAALANAAAFEVTSVKPNVKCGGGRGGGGAPSPGRVTLECAELRDLILTAYGIYANGAGADPRSFRMQVTGGPAWVDSDRFDIAAKAGGDPPREQLCGPMLQNLLEDRFHLKVHRETNEAPVFYLTIAKGGAKLPPTKCGAGAHACGSQATGENSFDMYGATIAGLCTQLGFGLDRDLVDKTGLTGTFDIHLEVAKTDLRPKFIAGAAVPGETSTPLTDDSGGPSLFTALRQQLGLRVESGKGPVDVLVIDHIEAPAAN